MHIGNQKKKIGKIILIKIESGNLPPRRSVENTAFIGDMISPAVAPNIWAPAMAYGLTWPVGVTIPNDNAVVNCNSPYMKFDDVVDPVKELPIYYSILLANEFCT